LRRGSVVFPVALFAEPVYDSSLIVRQLGRGELVEVLEEGVHFTKVRDQHGAVGFAGKQALALETVGPEPSRERSMGWSAESRVSPAVVAETPAMGGDTCWIRYHTYLWSSPDDPGDRMFVCKGSRVDVREQAGSKVRVVMEDGSHGWLYTGVLSQRPIAADPATASEAAIVAQTFGEKSYLRRDVAERVAQASGQGRHGRPDPATASQAAIVAESTSYPVRPRSPGARLASPYQAASVAESTDRRSGSGSTAGILVVAGAVIAMVGYFLPWVTWEALNSLRLSGFDSTFKEVQNLFGTSLVSMKPWLAIIPVAALISGLQGLISMGRRAGAGWFSFLCPAAILCASAIFAATLDTELGSVSLEAGPFITMAGAALIIVTRLVEMASGSPES
jgi:SH3-like domain-containing protein